MCLLCILTKYGGEKVDVTYSMSIRLQHLLLTPDGFVDQYNWLGPAALRGISIWKETLAATAKLNRPEGFFIKGERCLSLDLESQERLYQTLCSSKAWKPSALWSVKTQPYIQAAWWWCSCTAFIPLTPARLLLFPSVQEVGVLLISEIRCQGFPCAADS